MASREERIAENETRFRDANEGLRGDFAQLGLEPSREALFICECGDTGCREIIRLTLDEYEAVRRDPNTFALVPGHDDTNTERVVTESIVDKNDRFAVVKKRESYRDVTEGTDPR